MISKTQVGLLALGCGFIGVFGLMAYNYRKRYQEFTQPMIDPTMIDEVVMGLVDENSGVVDQNLGDQIEVVEIVETEADSSVVIVESDVAEFVAEPEIVLEGD